MLPNHLFYSKNKENISYSINAPGQLNVDKLINGKPCWQRNASTKGLTPKTLVLADWTASFWTDKQLHNYINKFNYLLEEGFTCYVWKNEELVPLTKENIGKLSQKEERNAISPIAPQELLTHIEESMRLQSYQVQILDDFELEHLFTAEKDRPIRSLDLSKLVDYYHERHKTDFFPILKEANLQPTIYYDECSNEADEFIAQYKKELEEFQGINDLKKITLKQGQLNQLYTEHFCEFDSTQKVNLDDLSAVEEIRLKKIKNVRILPDVLNRAGTLKKLNIERSTLKNIPQNLKLETVEELTLDECSFDANDLYKIIAPAKHLKSLQIIYGAIPKHYTENHDFSSLESLNLTYIHTSGQFLEHLLSQAAKLQTLNLEGFYDQKNYPGDNSIHLSFDKLHTLNLSGAVLSKPLIEKILSQARDLKSLSIGKQIQFSAVMNKLGHIKNLEQLTVSNPLVMNDDLIYLIAHTPNLHQLTLNQCNKTGEVNFEKSFDLKLPLLHELQIKNSSFNTEQLTRIFTGAPHLRSVTLDNCNSLTTACTQQYDLYDLHHLKISSSPIHSSIVQQILNHAHQLKSLELTDFKLLEEEQLERVDLNSLELLSITSHNLSLKTIEKLLSNASSLKELNLSDSPNISPDLEFNVSLPKLEKLSLNCKLNQQSLQNMLLLAPNLKSLIIGEQVLTDQLNIPLHLNKLQTCAVNLGNSTSKKLHHFVGNSTKLKSLTLSKTTLLDEITQEFNLNSLETLQLVDCKISAQSLKKLIANAPNLKKLKFKLCTPDLKQDPEIAEILKRLKEGKPIEAEPHPKMIMKELEYSEESVDADTRDDNLTVNVTRIFYPVDPQKNIPEPNRYRQSIFNAHTVSLNPCTINNAFTLKREGDIALVDALGIKACQEDVFADGEKLSKTENALFYYGKQTLDINSNWQALASLSPNEVLTHYHTDPKINIEIKYSQRDNQYYVRSTTNTAQLITIDFLLRVPKSPLMPQVPTPMSQIIKVCRQFTEGSLKVDKPNPTGVDYLQYILKQKKGACRHSALLFKEYMHQKLPDLPVRIVANECHMYPEVYLQGHWWSADLGGYPAELVINEENNPHKRHPLSDKGKQNAEAPQTPAKPAFTHRVINETTAHKQKMYIKNALETWRHNVTPVISALELSQQLISRNEQKKHLINIPDNQDLETYKLYLQKYCHSIHRPFFVINSPNDLVCLAPYVARDHDAGIMKKGPGGRLHDFLTAAIDKNNPPVLIVNCDNFSNEEIVHLNEFLDGRADGTPIPEETRIIALRNPSKPDCYQGSDFTSRFDVIKTCPQISNAHLEQEYFESPEQEHSTAIPINLYHSPNWEELLLGNWMIQGNELRWSEGKLIDALKANLPIEIQNGPWHDERFNRFWQQAFTLGYIDHAGCKIPLPDKLKLRKTDHYDWSNAPVSWHNDFKPEAPVLNPTLLNRLFVRYDRSLEQKALYSKEGLIQAHAQNTLHVNLTNNLAEDQWAMLVDECKKHQVQLVCHAAPAVRIPDFLKAQVIQESTWDQELRINPGTLIIASSDVDVTVAQMCDGGEWQIIDVSECDASDLLIKLSGEFNQDSLRFEFNQSNKAVLQALAQNKRVMLKGKFSQELCDSLAPLLLERLSTEDPNGQLAIVSTLDAPFQYLQTIIHQVSVEEKLTILNQKFSVEEIQILAERQEEPLAKLRARLQSNRRYPSSSTDKAWEGMKSLPVNFKIADIDSETFIQQRLDALKAYWALDPFVCITGLTGVGKSTFVETYLNTKNSKVFKGESRLREWATSTFPGRKVLFIDEANITDRDWSELEGLYNDPPGILIDGEYFPLTPEHCVCVAMNPQNYSEERHLPAFFERRGNALVFEPMPKRYLYEHIIKPVFDHTPLSEHSEDIAKHFLSVYDFLVKHSHDEVLISPRELQMMALLVLNYHQHNPQADLAKVAANYAYTLGKDLVPKHLQNLFKTEFKPKTSLTRMHETPEFFENKFLMTPSRQRTQQQLSELLDLRNFRRNEAMTHQQAFGGINGMILEGSPGIGKSQLVRETLEAHGYREAFLDQDIVPEHCYYRLPIKMQPDEKKRLLLKAFDEGAVVIIDEINSSPIMERLINELLIGKTPEGKRPAHPGFTIIGTQNPTSSLGSRKELGNAVKRRFRMNTPPDYTTDEMKTILIHQGLSAEMATHLVTIYDSKITEARTKNLRPEPNFRDLNKLAKQFITAERKKREQLAISIEKQQETTQKHTPEIRVEPDFIQLCASYETPLQKIKALLGDYVQRNRNYSSTFFSEGAHTTQIDHLLKEKEIETEEAFMEQFDKISTPVGDKNLQARITFIHNHILPSTTRNVEMKDTVHTSGNKIS